ncbi:uncharacterized protein LOC124308332 isoform X1 [Neodiprion virginianus]|uniref:uncharacterized protein LOC124308332 isoform X1 n=3 Tax=Neodiprion virginianus TaxID=2961670 RepID=UPI001EE726CA|nr:uncharacterized protein LOC124308332 isoform X1 [Neodiprion virginianus]XP_046626876.1 uncharacterized protein LOC124308332 isoform X1 [Neodiprion virginianus]XP_046626877.1 uncharacterized protein LOC124308332 isoform X1 [Neodiprion virginianus]XP_046626878.1 uncharacterized protein LOC124308332 isoform X1 [Neodiprion virginianus]XP_046626879.1 uncharacterized protein LOC124308332 isoform X1 [Neodiprion virginianus]
MSWLSSWSPLQVLLFIVIKYANLSVIMPVDKSISSRVVVAASHAALSGDLAVLILGLHPSDEPTTVPLTDTDDADTVLEEERGGTGIFQAPLVLRVLRLDGFTSELVGQVTVRPVPSAGGNLSLTVPCGFLSRGGTYSLQLVRKNSPVPSKLTDISSIHDTQMRTTLDVRWPTPSLSLEPQHFETYPRQPVLATIEYTGVSCTPYAGVPVAAYSLELIYCGPSVLSCDTRNKSHVQVLYSEEIMGFPAQKVITLRCELFGQAGHYALRLKPTAGNPTAPTTSAYIKVEWSDEFVFNIHARSVYPCDGGSGGVSVLFEYPACRLQGDRVRVYGRLRADVASLAPPSTLHYLAELKAPPGKHTLTFDCEIFTERFVEYCFSYVSQAITGAMSQVRVDCIPTFLLQDGDAGGWGPWSQWTPCSSSCVGGTRHRYRFCDTPPPKYGAKFCQGQAVETETCGGTNHLDLHGNWNLAEWECRHGKELAAEKPEVAAEIGSVCRCGCLVILDRNKMQRILAASTQACPGRSFWLVQAEADHRVRLHLDQARFPCKEQYVRVRDGDSLTAELLADVAFDKNSPISGTVTSSDTHLLVEFFSGEESAVHASCVGGYLAHATMFANIFSANETAMPADFLSPKIMAAAGRWAQWLTPAHLAAATLLVLIFLVSVFLALQYAFKYRKYEIAEDLDSLTDNSAFGGSMQGLARRARALSSATLFSEVVSLIRLPRMGSPKHARLQEAPADVEDDYECAGSQAIKDDSEVSEKSGTLKSKGSDENLQTTIVQGSVDTHGRQSSTCSIPTLGQPEVKYARPVKLRTVVGPISPVSEERSTSELSRRYSITSTSISLNNVRVPHPKSSTFLQVKGFSPASTSSNASNLRCGKESKDRRNRERLLQGPGSEFSLANQDMDLELDYYDYNVVNAGAAPGSYLGMDPAFLVWIPPLDPGESDIVRAIEEDHHYEEVPERRGSAGSRLKLNTEGASLTPSEYKLMRESKARTATPGSDGTAVHRQKEISPKRIDHGESRLHDEIITEYRARLSEGILPIHRILEESRVRVSDESLAKYVHDDALNIVHADVIPNRMTDEGEKFEARFAPRANRIRLSDEQDRRRNKTTRNPDLTRENKFSDDDGGRSRMPANAVSTFSDELDCSSKVRPSPSRNRGVSEEIVRNRAYNENELTKTPDGLRERRNNSDASRCRTNGRGSGDPDKDRRDWNDESHRGNIPMPNENTPNAQHFRFKEDVAELNIISDVRVGNAVNIPLKEFPIGRFADSPAKVHCRPKDKRNEANLQKEIQSPDYGVEIDIKEDSKGFYELIGEGEDGLKFADDDDDSNMY